MYDTKTRNLMGLTQDNDYKDKKGGAAAADKGTTDRSLVSGLENAAKQSIDNETISISSHTIKTEKEPAKERFVTAKVHQLDWFDVEARIKLICDSLI